MSKSTAPVLLLVTFLGALHLACSGPPLQLPDGADLASLRSVALAPVLVSSKASPELIESRDRVRAATQHVLNTRGYQAPAISDATFNEVWSRALRDAERLETDEGTREDEVRAARVAAAKVLAKRSNADGVLFAVLLERWGEIEGKRKIKWDDATDKVEVTFVNHFWDFHTPSGRLRTASIRVWIFDREGRELYSTLHGLEPVQYFEVDGGRYRVLDRPDLLEDSDRLRREIEETLAPFLGAAESAKTDRP